MKYRKHATLLAISATLLAAPSISQAQLGGDPTTPPTGVPTRTMKTLDQVEARIPLVEGAPGVAVDAATGTITISQSGSYYMVENLSLSDGDGIIITANNVTLDLNGYLITKYSSGGASGDGISVLDSYVTIENGKIASAYSGSQTSLVGLGFDYGIRGLSTKVGLVVRNVTVSGSDTYGISGPDLVENCNVYYSADGGIIADAISNSVARNCAGDALRGDIIQNSIGHSYGGNGIFCLGTVSNSKGQTDSASRTGIVSLGTVSFSYGYNAGVGVGINGDIVIGSTAGADSTISGIQHLGLAP